MTTEEVASLFSAGKWEVKVIATFRSEVETVDSSSAGVEAAEVVGEALTAGTIVMKNDLSSLPQDTASMKKKWQLLPNNTLRQTRKVMSYLLKNEDFNFTKNSFKYEVQS